MWIRGPVVAVLEPSDWTGYELSFMPMRGRMLPRLFINFVNISALYNMYILQQLISPYL
jgi:hypothetical protein